jgi:RNA polymerase sigma-70 factor (ECF subfamily)
LSTNPSSIDSDWLEAARGSDSRRKQAAWEALFRQYRRLVYAVALRLVNDPETAEDVVQETFLQVHRYADRFRGEGSLRAWILTIAANLARRWIVRERARGRLPSVAVEDPPDPPLASETLERREQGERIRQALAELPPAQRLAVTLSCIEGLSGREVARILDCEEGTVWSRVYHAKRQLLEKIGGAHTRREEGR